MNIDVIIRTLECIKTIRECIESVERNIPLNKIIIVDGGSKDGTLQYLYETELYKKGKMEVYVNPELSLGEAVYFGIHKASTSTIACIDSDVVISSGWFESLNKCFADDIAVVEGGTIEHLTIPFPFNGEKHRGYLINMLAKRDPLLLIVPERLYTRDDAYMQYCLEKKIGKRWVKSGVLLADHYSDAVRYRNTGSYLSVHRFNVPKKDIYQSAYVDRLIGAKGRVFRLFVDSFYKPLLLWRDMIREWFLYLEGWFKKY